MAQVDSLGKLEVSDGKGPLTIDGSVHTTQQLPGTPFFKNIQVDASQLGALPVIFKNDKGVRLYVTSVSLRVYSGSATPTAPKNGNGGFVVFTGPPNELDCAHGSFGGDVKQREQFSLNASTSLSSSATFPTPVELSPSSKNGTRLCVLADVGVPGDGGVFVTISGYTK